MIYNVHAGHGAVGKGSIGAVGLLNESIEDRVIKDKVINELRAMGHTVYDCTVDTGTQSRILSNIVKKCNSHKVNLDVSIHFNSGANRYNIDGNTCGTEVYVYDNSAMKYAQAVASNISLIGFRNRGVKINKNLKVLRDTIAPAMLIEVCFVDDGDDAQLYRNKINDIAHAIVKGLTQGVAVVKPSAPTNNTRTLVKINVPSLNIRTGAGTQYNIVGEVHKNEVYTIVGFNGSWGKLKSGAGWINCSTKYVKYV